MTRIYTKTGDLGETGLFGGGRVLKSDARVDSYGEVDELNAFIGLARASKPPAALDEMLARIQNELFTVGAVLATPKDTKASAHIPQVEDAWVERLEAQMDAFTAELPPLTQFILPGGGPTASALHVARTVCRRAERRVVPLARAGEVAANVVVYLNRLSDWCFTAARFANAQAGVPDVTWQVPAAPAAK